MTTRRVLRTLARMQLSTMTDFEAVKDRWRHYWAGEVKGRPLVWASATRPGMTPGNLSRRYWHAVQGNHDVMMREIDQWLAATEFLGETVHVDFLREHPGRVAHAAHITSLGFVGKYVETVQLDVRASIDLSLIHI